LKFYFYIPFLFLLSGCEEKSQNQLGSLEWTIDTNYLRMGCFSGKDCIPSLQSPNESDINGDHLTFLNDPDLVVGVWDGNQYRAFPHAILDWHEIINENGYSISYCPLTGSALHIKTDSEFGVSGYLFNSNLIMYDRNSDSHWPQMLLKSAEGSRQGDRLKLRPLIETKWSTWKKLFPNSKVVNSQTGFSRDYNEYPYGRYRSCNSASCNDYIYFPIPPIDERLPAKTRVLSIITETTQIAYPINSFTEPTILNKTIDGHSYSIILSSNDNLGVAFKTSSPLSISLWDTNNGLITLEDSNGHQYNILGRSIDGESEDLTAATSFISYWFSQAAFYPDTEIHL